MFGIGKWLDEFAMFYQVIAVGYNFAMTLNGIEKRKRTAAWMPVLADVLGIGALFVLLAPVTEWLITSVGLNVFIVIVTFVLFCLGVYLIRKLETPDVTYGWHPPDILLDRRVRAGLAVLFGLMMTTILAYQLGYFASVETLGSFEIGEGESSSLFVYMPGALLGVSMLYVLVLAFPVNDNVVEGTLKSAVFALLGPLLMNSLLFILVAQFKIIFTDLAVFGPVGTLILTAIFLGIAFTPPRLILQTKYPLEWSLFSFAVLLISGAFIVSGP